MEVKIGEGCPRKKDPWYGRKSSEHEIAWTESVRVCSLARSFGLESEWNCADCEFPPPLYDIVLRSPTKTE